LRPTKRCQRKPRRQTTKAPRLTGIARIVRRKSNDGNAQCRGEPRVENVFILNYTVPHGTLFSWRQNRGESLHKHELVSFLTRLSDNRNRTVSRTARASLMSAATTHTLSSCTEIRRLGCFDSMLATASLDGCDNVDKGTENAGMRCPHHS
jgi:hypothetical protein